MIKRSFDNHEKMCEYMIDRAQDGLYTVAVLFYEDAIKLLKELMMYIDITPEFIEVKPVECDGYRKEYYVSLTNDMIVSVEPAYVDGKYLNAEADLILIDGDASSSILKHVREDRCCEISIGEPEYEHEDVQVSQNEKKLNKIFDKAKLIKNKDDCITGIQIDIKALVEYLLD